MCSFKPNHAYPGLEFWLRSNENTQPRGLSPLAPIYSKSVFRFSFFFFFFYITCIATAAILIFFKIRPRGWKDRPKSWWVQLGLFLPTPVFLILENYRKSDFRTFCKKKVIFSINGQKYHSYAFFHEGGPRFSSSWVNLATF